MEELLKLPITAYRNEKVQEIARQFYSDNSYAYTYNGKQQALLDIESLDDYEEHVKLMLMLAIGFMTLEELKGKLADNDEYKIFDHREVDDMRLVYNMENEPIIEIIKDGK